MHLIAINKTEKALERNNQMNQTLKKATQLKNYTCQLYNSYKHQNPLFPFTSLTSSLSHLHTKSYQKKPHKTMQQLKSIRNKQIKSTTKLNQQRQPHQK